MKIPGFFNRKKDVSKRLNLAFHEIRILEKKSIFKKADDVFVFFSYLPIYFIKKQRKFLSFSKKIFSFVYSIFKKAKNFVAVKLIWGRGRLSRVFINIGTLILITLVFLAGGFFRTNLIIYSRNDQELYITSNSDIVTQAIVINESRLSSAGRDTDVSYTVVSGDTLSTIGKKFGVSLDTIRYANNLVSTSSLKVGQELIIPPVSGISYKIKSRDTLASIARVYKTNEQAIADFNYLIPPFDLKVGDTIFLPDATIPTPVTVPAIIENGPQVANVDGTVYSTGAYVNLPLATKGKKGTGRFIWPTTSHYISQKFSSYHPGIDIAKYGPIYAADDGVIIRSGWWAGGYGFAIQIDHRNGYVTTYAHMSKLLVSVGKEVKQGQTIGLMGTTGRSTGIHLHFTIQQNGRFLNPLSFY